jgi:Arc/MetJ-type ribon-helix-helix transcriptional regulator
MTSLQLLLPDELKALAEKKIADGRYSSVADYVVALIREDCSTGQALREEEILRTRLASGPSREMGDGDFKAIRQRLEAEIVRRRGA